MSARKNSPPCSLTWVRRLELTILEPMELRRNGDKDSTTSQRWVALTLVVAVTMANAQVGYKRFTLAWLARNTSVEAPTSSLTTITMDLSLRLSMMIP